VLAQGPRRWIVQPPPDNRRKLIAQVVAWAGIARKQGLSLKALQDLNPGVGSNLRIGQKLKVK
jgi:hypothetical protein